MKAFLALLLLIWSSSSLAVQTKYCPAELDIQTSDIKVFSKSFVEDRIVEKDFSETNREAYDQQSIDFFLNSSKISALDLTFKKMSTENANCYYERQEAWGGYMFASITGTDKEPLLTLTYKNDPKSSWEEGGVEVLLFANEVKSKRPFYSFSDSELQIKTQGIQNSWGDFYTTYISVGKTKLSVDPSKKYQIDPDNWKVDLLLDTCSGMLEEAISEVLADIGANPQETAVLLPKAIGYKYFKVSFRYIEGLLVYPTDEIEYEFEYSTEDDQHSKCSRVQGVDFVY